MKSWKDGRKLINLVCDHCGISFEKTQSEYRRNEVKGRKHYCSRKCSTTHYVDHTIYLCKFCDNEIKSRDSRKLFCSHSCSASFNNKNRVGEKRHFSSEAIQNIRNANKRIHNKNENIEYDENPNYCKECGQKLSYKHRKRIFCCIDCKRKYDRKNLNEYQKYYKDCQFKFNLSDYPNEFDFELIKKYGWYKAKNHGDNLNGVSRDHMISVKYGYENNILPELIHHPANCQLLRHNDNVSKYKKCSLTLKELEEKIQKWNLKYD